MRFVLHILNFHFINNDSPPQLELWDTNYWYKWRWIEDYYYDFDPMFEEQMKFEEEFDNVQEHEESGTQSNEEENRQEGI